MIDTLPLVAGAPEHQARGALLQPRALAVKGNDGDFKGEH